MVEQNLLTSTKEGFSRENSTARIPPAHARNVRDVSKQ